MNRSKLTHALDSSSNGFAVNAKGFQENLRRTATWEFSDTQLLDDDTCLFREFSSDCITDTTCRYKKEKYVMKISWKVITLMGLSTQALKLDSLDPDS